MPNRNIKLLFTLFALSGFTALIYESIWSHYLKLFLGSAAFAQSFVLMAFMGGMALGAWLASRASKKMSNLLAAYGWIEAMIGIAALLFHELFILLTEASLQHVIPVLGSPLNVEIYKYALCALLIVPQTVLLGMTFPLMSGSVIRRSPQASGHHLAMLYFTNSIGAAAGVLIAAFVFIGTLGMPGTMRLAGVINLILAAIVLIIAYKGEPTATAASPRPGTLPLKSTLVRLFLAGAFITGMASFIYEIAWIRMLSLVLGTSFQAFELMLSAFITGLALGGLWMRKRIDLIADPVRYLGMVQFAMGLAALGTVFVYHYSFDWMAWVMGVLQKNAAAYPLFNLFSHAIAFAVMLPATFLAGMTLPLFTHVLLRGGHGERAIGQIYACNTLGAIAGVLVAVHVLMPDSGLKLTLIIGAVLDIILGGWLLRYSLAAFRRAHAFAAIIIGMLAATATARAEVLEPERLSSGVYRYGRAVSDNKVHFYRDGKTASVAVRSNQENMISIITNGKPDAAINLDQTKPPTSDEYTMTLLGALPLLLKPDARHIANIGFGSGLTAEVILSHGAPQQLDTVEIEPAMVAGARSFFPRVIRPYRDGRSFVYFEDAKSYLARHGKRYDVIISEPSNPWVNGVAGLFTTEFYRDIRRYLKPEGLFVQWLQLYEFNDKLVASILSAMDENFSDYTIYEANNSDLIVIAVAKGTVPALNELPAEYPVFIDQLKRIEITSKATLSAMSLGDKRRLSGFYSRMGSPVNSDFQPYVQLEAPKARFESDFARGIYDFSLNSLPILEMLGKQPVVHIDAPVARNIPSVRLRAQSAALNLADGLLNRPGYRPDTIDPVLLPALAMLRSPGTLCGKTVAKEVVLQLHRAAEITLSHLGPKLRSELWVKRTWIPCPARSMSDTLRLRLELYSAIARRDAPAMLALATQLLALGPDETGDAWGRFVLETALLGARAAGQTDELHKLWQQYGTPLYPQGKTPEIVRYLLALK